MSKFTKGQRVFTKSPAVVSHGFLTETVGYTKFCGVVVADPFEYVGKLWVPIVWDSLVGTPYLTTDANLYAEDKE